MEKNMHRLLPLFLIAAAASVLAEDDRPRNAFGHDILAETFGYGPGTESLAAYDQIYQGCPRRDCIPSIDSPEYVPAKEASFMAPETIVLGIDIEGEQRAYPLPIMDRHEIVNDHIGGQAIAVTWCPLCGSGIVFEPIVGGEVVDFGVSGLLHDSDLVMYDRKTESLWQQISGEAIMGPQIGSSLNKLPSTMTEWSNWVEAHPNTRVLSPKSLPGDYFSSKAYAGYEESERLMFPVSNRDLSVHPKSVVYGFEIGAHSLAVMESSLGRSATLETTLGEHELRIERIGDGSVVATDASGRQFDPIRLFWFAWYSFHPDTQRL